MPDNKSDGDPSAIDEPPDKNSDLSDSEFVEMDHTGRYGRYKEVLGKGAFKTVYRAFDEVDGIEVAWNQVKIQDLLQSPEELERLYSEVHLLKSLKHKNIIKFYNSWVDTKIKNVNFITEIFTSGTLRQYRKKHKHVDMKAVKNWARQILRGLLYLHSHDPPIIHRDLKCDNIFVNGNSGEVKIGDLGLATILRQAHAAHSVIGTPEFMAPELYEEEYNELVDIYSFGMCLLELVTFEYPYSECTNAAQIYKKVTSGKKPAALERVKDLDVRQFIEKCLAVASKRLPARELLTDPFLQSDGNREHLECLVPIQRSELIGGDMDELIVKGEPESRYCHKASNSGPAELVSNISGVKCGYESGHSMSTISVLPNGGNKGDRNVKHIPSLPSPSPKEDQPRRSRDFRVKGKKRDEGTVFLRLRIADTLGHIRNIHFLFDIEGDTAMSVASEMVEELDLSDQDVTTIAEMIDAEIVALVPEWKPGASFDETGPDTEDCGDQVDPAPDSIYEKAKSETTGNDGTDGDEPCLDRVSSSRKILSPSFRPSAYDGSPSRGEGMMYGRFEEVTYNQGGSDYSPCSSGVAPPLSSNSSERHADEESAYHLADPSSPISDDIGKGTWSTIMGSPCIHPSSNVGDVEPVELGCSSFNDLVESQRIAGCSKYTHQTWEGIMNMAGSLEERVGFTEDERDGSPEGFPPQPPWPKCGLAVYTPPDHTDGEEDFGRELNRLKLKQEQEFRELQRKHEQAILEVKSRCERSGSTASSNLASPDILQCNSSDLLISKHLPLCSSKHARSLCSVSSLEREVGHFSAVKCGHTTSETIESDRLSLKELAAMTARVAGGDAVKSASSEQSCSGVSDGQGVLVPNAGASEPTHFAINLGPNANVCSTVKCEELLCGSEQTCLQGLGTRYGAENPAPVDNSSSGMQRELCNPATFKSESLNLKASEKPDLVFQGRRESYIEFYKTAGIEREKLPSHKLEMQASDAGAQEPLSKSSSSKLDDRALELKKEQLQRSIAELEAKTLEGLHCSKNGFLATHAPKKTLVGSSVQSASGGSSASQTRPHPVSESNKA